VSGLDISTANWYEPGFPFTLTERTSANPEFDKETSCVSVGTIEGRTFSSGRGRGASPAGVQADIRMKTAIMKLILIDIK
jgi:hypothetical protein